MQSFQYLQKIMEKHSIFSKLQTRWGVNSVWQVLIILVVFACTGFTVLFLKKPIYALLNISPQTPVWWRVTVYCLTILPAYQIILLMYGFLFGQFQFFWNFEKRMFGRIANVFTKKQPKTDK